MPLSPNSTLDSKMTPSLSRFTATSSLPVSSDEGRRRRRLRSDATSKAVAIKSSWIRTHRDTVREHCKRTDSLSVNICDSGSASQGMNLSLCPFLTLKSPMGPGGCGKWEARSLLNSCVIEFPHNTANVCMDAGTSVPRARRVKQGPKIPRAHLVSKQ